MRQLPHFVIIGGMKCATSTLNRQLSHQPGIFIPTTSEGQHELNFFSNDEQFNLGIDWYRSLFNSTTPDSLFGEDSTHYTKLPTYPNTVKRMRAHIPEAKLIYLMRHPVERLVSHYKHLWTERVVECPIDQALKTHQELIDYSRYAMQITPFIDQYASDRILPVFFERFIAYPQEELERICQFIGYSGKPKWNAQDAKQNVSAERMRKSEVRDTIVWNPVSTWLRRTFVSQSVRDKIKRYWQFKGSVDMNIHTIQHLEGIFDKDLARLGEMLGINLSCKSFKSTVKDTIPVWQL